MAEISEVTTRLLDYISYDTQSEDDRESILSAKKQFELAHKLVEELKELRASQVRMSEQGYVYACIPSNLEERKMSLTLGFIAHMDTAPSLSDKGAKPRFIRDYGEQDIRLNREQDIWTRTTGFPDLEEYEGRTPITTDEATLLGTDDKAGVAEIITMAAYFLRHPEVKHGTIYIDFTPDEKVGRGTDGFGVEGFGTDVTYTVDGGALRELGYEDFNAASGRVTIHGASTHPGTVGGHMRNILLMTMKFQSLFPADENSIYTEGYGGLYHLDRVTGCVEEARMDYIIRNHGRVKFEHKKELFIQAAGFLNRKYGFGTMEAVVKDSYYNTKEKIEPHVDLIDKARAFIEKLGIRPVVVPIRGGTGSARLSYTGLPCPDLCTGDHNFHGKYEFTPVQSVEEMTELLVEIARSFAETITDGAAGPCLLDAPAF